jgi:hypothetical protein
MATTQYMAGRKKYGRPQAILFSDNAGRMDNGFYVPNGYEIGANVEDPQIGQPLNAFLILSDDNRQPIDFKPTRIETRKRTVNGRMRSYHVADKLTISTSWNMLPSRSFAQIPNFDDTGKSVLVERSYREPGNDGQFKLIPNTTVIGQQYTTDGGAGGVDLLDWYENHKGPFWVYLAYDKLNNFEAGDSAYGNLPKYNQVMEMYISDFNYSVQKRGGMHDFWNISITLEEA